MNISAAAQALGVSPEVLRRWDDRIPTLNIPRDNAGRRRFDDDSLGLLRIIKQLSEQGRSYDTITAVLDKPSPDVLTGAPIAVQHDAAQKTWYDATLEAARDAAVSREVAILAALDDAREEREGLEREVGSLRERIAELASRNETLAHDLRNTNERLERAELMSAVRQEPSTRQPWWKFW